MADPPQAVVAGAIGHRLKAKIVRFAGVGIGAGAVTVTGWCQLRVASSFLL